MRSPTDTSAAFGTLLRRERKARDLTQEALAKAAFCALDTIKKLESGRRRPSRSLATQIADVLGLDGETRTAFLAAARSLDARQDDLCPAVVAPHTLPVPLTSFIGRAEEIMELVALLGTPHGRLVSLIGPGGIGKTRVALALAERLISQDDSPLQRFADGVVFVPLQAVDSAEQVVSAIGYAVCCPPAGATEPHEHLLAYLQPRRLLLILDAFEHLRPHVALLTAILTRAPGVTLLVTTREALNLTVERRYPIAGFLLAPETAVHDLEQSDAVRLFVARARHARPQFDLTAEGAAVLRICRLLDGVPLAVELAATWVSTLSCAAIAEEILGNRTFLTSTSSDVPERHRSMRAVFDASWAHLSEDERHAFAQLSVFRGGFPREAAFHVAGAPLTTLRGLVDKSLLRWEAGDRYQIHELLRQYAAERLDEPGEGDAARERHAAYYTGFLALRAEDVNGRRQRAALREIGAELENVRSAWQHALERQQIDQLQQAAYTFYLFHDYRSHFHEGVARFSEAVDRLDDAATTQSGAALVAELLVCLGWLCIRVGELERARACLERSRQLLTEHALGPRPGPGTDPLTALGTLACVQGDYAVAARLGEQARQNGEARADKGNLMYAYYVLTDAALALGHYGEARQAGERACALAEQMQDRWFLSYLVANLGHIARAAGDYPEARRQYQLSYELREEYGDPQGLAAARTHLGQVALLQRDPVTAAEQFACSLELYSTINDRGGIATALEGMGRSEVASGSYAVAAGRLQEALQIATAIAFVPRIHAILLGVAELMLAAGAAVQAAGLLVALISHPASSRETIAWARDVLARCASILGTDAYDAATKGQQNIDMDAIAATLQALNGRSVVFPGSAASDILTER